jgi:glutamine---fructose-6-phosphate transaminase (isomerizing)
MTKEIFPRPKAKANEPSTDAPYDENRLRRVKLTLDEAMIQDEIIRAALEVEMENLKEVAALLKSRKIRRVYILGCGDSWFVG